MAKLPTAAELGFAQAAPTRPVGSFDATPVARGAEAIGRATENLGQATAREGQGVASVGQGISQLGAGLGVLGDDQSRWQYAKAHADFLSNKTDLDAATKQDSNYGPDDAGKDLTGRYTDQLNAYRANSANMIQDPRWRDLFMQQTQNSFEQGQLAVASHARSLSNDSQIAYVTQMGDKTINQAVAAPDDATRTQLIDSHNQLIDGLSNSGAITDVQAAKMKQAWAHQYATADVLARSNSDPQGVINELRAQPGSPDAVTNRIVQIEGSGKNPASSSSGVGQFIEGTWLDVLKRNRPDLAAGRSDQDLLALRADPKLAYQMTQAYQRENTAALQQQGLPTTPGNIYLAHFLGAGGATAVLKADPNMPVADALTQALGPAKAQAMITANPTILQGKLAGSVKDWADARMGGASPGGGSIYDMLRPDVREALLAHAQTQLQKQTALSLSDFKQRIDDSLTEASRTGNVQQPLQLTDFISHAGADLGTKMYQTYQANIQTARDTARVASLDPQEMGELVQSYAPKPGPGYADQAQRQDLVMQAVRKSLKERSDDPAGFAATRLPGTQAAYSTYQSVMASPQASDTDRANAARSFAATSLLEQQGSGIPPGQRQILPKADVDQFKAAVTRASTSDDPSIRVGLIRQIQAQQKMWGDYWPQVVGQLSPQVQPVVRAIAAGADPDAMTRLLSIGPKENPAAILKEQSETKAKDVQTALNTEMAPLLSTMLPVQRDRDFAPYYDMADKLAALYVRDGQDASSAAHNAYMALIGNRYDFRDTWRIPKDAGVSADDVQAGALAARGRLAELGAKPAIDDVGGLTNAAADSLSKFGRDGTWVTSPHNDGLNLMYGGKAVRGQDGQPLFLPWVRLAQLGGTNAARAAAVSTTLAASGVMSP